MPGFTLIDVPDKVWPGMEVSALGGIVKSPLISEIETTLFANTAYVVVVVST